jgi:signal transduction histidine kinase/ligand-binding sensor domain-containing protein/DNA-binding response OmpR family regulator
VSRCFYVVLLIFLTSFSLFSQDISFKRLTGEQFIGSGAVYCVLQDKTGYLWFGTEYGLYRYDGRDFRTFRHDPDNPNSISDNTIWAVYEDHQGFLWIGTANGGLNRFNPTTEKFQHWLASDNTEPIGPGLSDNSITCIQEDSSGFFWIGTYRGGLNRFDPTKSEFQHWFRDKSAAATLDAFYVTCLYLDAQDQLWVGTYEGLYKLNLKSDSIQFLTWKHDSKNPNSLNNNIVWNIFESKQDSGRGLWIGTFDGLDFFEKESGNFSHHIPFKNDPDPFSRSIGSISEETDHNRRLFWVASYNGLLRFDPVQGTFERWQQRENDPASLSNNQVTFLYRDRSGVLWIATNNGLNYYSHQWNKFRIWSFDSPETHSGRKTNKEVTAICPDQNGILWVGTTSGLYYLKKEPDRTLLKKYPQLALEYIWSLAPGKTGELWIGTYGNGLFRLQTDSNQIQHWLAKSSNQDGPGNNYIRSLCQDHLGYLWVGLWGRGINRYNPATGEWKSYIYDRDDPNSLSYNDVWAIHEDHYGQLWIGTKGGGLNLFDRETEKFFRWQSTGDNQAKLSHNGVISITEIDYDKTDSDKNLTKLWIGSENGLVNFTYLFTKDGNHNSDQARIITFSEKDGLPSSMIKSAVQDNLGNLWIGTNMGLLKFSLDSLLSYSKSKKMEDFPKELRFDFYTMKDGLPSEDFSIQAVAKNKNGELFWGTKNGLISFYPNRLQKTGAIPPIAITEIQVMNEPILTQTYISSSKSGTGGNQLKLPYNQNIISFRFASMDFTAPQECLFSYKLEGFDKGWVFSGRRRFISYTNLNPGSYTFRVRGSNSDGVWSNNEAIISFTIMPPWWKTAWAYLFYGLFVIATLFGIRRFEVYRIRLRHQLAMQTLETQKFQELERSKSRFFTNLSHEFRTPLMLIRGPIEQIQAGAQKTNIQKLYDLIFRNSNRLMELIDQILAISQIEAGVLPLQTREMNVISLLHGLVSSFDSLAEQKRIKLVFDSKITSFFAWIDQDKFEKIINNILSNAFKFTNEEGTISCRASEKSCKSKVNNLNWNTDKYLEIAISDTGIGIPEDQQKRIFDRFYQVDDSLGKKFPGTGIGLALVKELIDLHHWDISLKSKSGEGSTFYICIPSGHEHLKDSEIISTVTEEEYISHQVSGTGSTRHAGLAIDNSANALGQNNQTRIASNIKHSSDAPEGDPIILIVEDSADVRFYLNEILKEDFRIEEATGAEEGFQMAISLSPDIILSDVLMPGVSGIEFCQRLKTDLRTSHIPVVLLTARASQESRLEGLETGADDYLIKPFERRELILRLKNLIEHRRRLMKKFQRDILVEPSAITVTSMDEDFIRRAMEVTEKHLDDPEFETGEFARSLNLSRSQLHRKLVGLTGQSPGEFIRIIRLKRAAQLLKQQSATISEVAYQVGFNNLSYFTKAFRQQFRCTPSEYMEKQKSATSPTSENN